MRCWSFFCRSTKPLASRDGKPCGGRWALFVPRHRVPLRHPRCPFCGTLDTERFVP